ncbi:hypothetical protein, partial [Bacteroides thetaiotaomicron]|uniref:hypothetical protein n=1 Tax=Bacteroides thetaiotaomicron TaxID=818 RepID=UPI00210A817E
RPKMQISLYDKYIKRKEDLIRADCSKGADNKGLCGRLGIGLTTFKSILNKHPEVKDLLKEGKDEADMKVE